ncbi:MAG: hypothetical protein LBK61_14645 [Spirochaetaceae bacterium]|nr:hypothetical protein [Spirochaetaceae bacterium]
MDPIPDSLSACPQFWSKEQRHGRQSTPLWRLCFPFGCAMPPQGGALPAETMPDRGGMNR